MTARAMGFAWDQKILPDAKLLLLFIGDNYGETTFHVDDVEETAPGATGLSKESISSMWPYLYERRCITQVSNGLHALFLPEREEKYEVVRSESGGEREASPGTVYLLKSGKYYKIGLTRQRIESRVKQLQRGVPYTIEIVRTHIVNDPEATEGHLHARLADRRKAGEWFDLVRDDIDYIDLVCGES